MTPTELPPTVAPATTQQQQLKADAQTANVAADVAKTAGQRRINIIWEVTQAVIALSVTISGLVVIVALTRNSAHADAALTMLNSAFFTIVGFYFGRTNHQRVGGVGGGITDEGR